MPLRSTASWSPLLLKSAAACCSFSPPSAANQIVHEDAASASLRDRSNSDASGLHSDLSIRSLRSLQISPDLLSFHSSSSSSFSSVVAVRYCLLASLTSHPRRSVSTSLAISPTGKLLYFGSHSGVAVYDLDSFRLFESFRSVAAGAVKSLVFSSDGLVFTAHQDSKIRVWRIPSPPVHDAAAAVEEPSSSDQRTARHSLVSSLPTVGDRLRRFALPGNYVAVRRHRKRLWIEHADAVTALAVRNGLLYSVSWDKTLKVWRTSDFRCLQSVPAHDDAVNAVAVAPDGTVYTGSADCRIRVWQQQQQPPPALDRTRRPHHRRRYSLVATLDKHRSAVNALALSADGGVLLSGSCDRSILVWERAESAGGHMAVAGAIRGHRRAVLCLAYVEDLLLSGSTDRTVRVWRRTAGGEYCCLAVMEGHAGGVRSVAGLRVCVPESESTESAVEEYRVCSGSSDGEVRVWRVRVSAATAAAAATVVRKGKMVMEADDS